MLLEPICRTCKQIKAVNAKKVRIFIFSIPGQFLALILKITFLLSDFKPPLEKIQNDPSELFLPHCTFDRRGEGCQFGSVLCSLSPEFIELIQRFTKRKLIVMAHFSKIFAILFLSFYVSSIFCEELSRQEAITGQFFCRYRLFLLKSFFFSLKQKFNNELSFDLHTHFAHQVITQAMQNMQLVISCPSLV